MNPTITDVAERAGVSVSTVSRVLNQTKHVDEKLRTRVLLAINELGYQPNQHARWLVSRRSNAIGLIMQSVDDSNGAEFLHACSTTLRGHGFSLMVGLTNNDGQTEVDLVHAYNQSHVSGVIFVPGTSAPRTFALLGRGEIPVVYAWEQVQGRSSHSVAFDTTLAARSLTEAVIRAGYRRIHVISGPHRDIGMKRRVAGCLAALEDNGIDVHPVTATENTVDAGRVTAELLLRQHRPDLLMCLSDSIAIGAIRGAFETGLRVPSDIAVTGFGENIYSHSCLPSLTTVRLHAREMGEACGHVIVELIQGRHVPRLSTAGFTLVEGGSCKLGGEIS